MELNNKMPIGMVEKLLKSEGEGAKILAGVRKSLAPKKYHRQVSLTVILDR